MDSDFTGPVNIGSDEMISINDLARMVIGISKKELTVKNISGPLGVRGRNSDNNLYLEKIGWRVSESLKSGIEKTFNWINKQVKAQSQQNVED
jgi:nucleoside-diphosphate-sugar epimerase